MITNAVNAMLLGLSPAERLRATGRLTSKPAPEYSGGEGTLLIAALVLVLLVLLLWWVSSKRKGHGQEAPREFFAESANRRGLGARERQILLAIVARSGLGQSEDIFTVVDAFDRGAAKLQEECGRTRTAGENERLRAEIASLRGKLGYELTGAPQGSARAKRPSSRDIPIGRIIELTRRQHDTSSVQAEVVRNDDIELAVELSKELDVQTGDDWQARYDFGTSLWEFDTTVVRCEGTRLVLNHSDQLRFINRRRFPRVAAHVPALLARLPAMKRTEPGVEAHGAAGEERLTPEPPVFVEGTITEIAGPGLRIEAPLQVGVDDRALIMFQLNDGAAAGAAVVSDIGRVRYVKKTTGGFSIAVELGGLSEADVDGLVHFAYAQQSRAGGTSSGSGPAEAPAMGLHAATAGGTA